MGFVDKIVSRTQQAVRNAPKPQQAKPGVMPGATQVAQPNQVGLGKMMSTQQPGQAIGAANAAQLAQLAQQGAAQQAATRPQMPPQVAQQPTLNQAAKLYAQATQQPKLGQPGQVAVQPNQVGLGKMMATRQPGQAAPQMGFMKNLMAQNSGGLMGGKLPAPQMMPPPKRFKKGGVVKKMPSTLATKPVSKAAERLAAKAVATAKSISKKPKSTMSTHAPKKNANW